MTQATTAPAKTRAQIPERTLRKDRWWRQPAINATLLWLYSLSCHACRHTVGGRLKHFSKHPVRYWMWTQVSRLNARHMQYAWLSLFWVLFTDLYIRLVASGAITDPRFF